ncbi:hypothetical protein ACFQRL_12545 [Microbacterium fluvii]|uniref:Uncharacterized protein n=1 Tax=Microbacterium fluvii TaxID=415215 RepID=A0ABW2HH01_9MICO|nr:hypothetical protein [Microbacterium fluvii]MCU4673426.1 hypothetical protein [Microbacterium fluvii]
MPVRVTVGLADAVAVAAVGGGTWSVTLSDNGRPVASQPPTPYSGAVLTATLAAASWSSAVIEVNPVRYAPLRLTVSGRDQSVYRDDPLSVVTAGADALVVSTRLLRLRESRGVPISPQPDPGILTGPWLTASGNPALPSVVYGDLRMQSFGALPSLEALSPPAAGGTVFADPDAPGWGRFNRITKTNLDMNRAGAPLLLEYGDVGSSTSGARFLVAIWAPAHDARKAPTEHDFVAFLHPNTSKPPFPPAGHPYRSGGYPYGVVPVPPPKGEQPSGRTFQPYVELAMRYLVGSWAKYRWPGNSAVVVMPIMPGAPPLAKGQTAGDDQLDYGRPFRDRSGMWRLVEEVKFFLHRVRYGLSADALTRWWGAGSGPPVSTTVTTPIPGTRRIAVAAYSASSVQLVPLLTSEAQGRRFDAALWGPSPTVQAVADQAWRETWALDPFTKAGESVGSDVFEKALLAWLGENNERRFVLGASGTTTATDLVTRFPALAAAATRRPVLRGSDPSRRAEFWAGPSNRWVAFAASNPYLTAAAPPTPPTLPTYPAFRDDDIQHAFMFELATGFAFNWTTVGRP